MRPQGFELLSTSQLRNNLYPTTLPSLHFTKQDNHCLSKSFQCIAFKSTILKYPHFFWTAEKSRTHELQRTRERTYKKKNSASPSAAVCPSGTNDPSGRITLQIISSFTRNRMYVFMLSIFITVLCFCFKY